MNMAESTVSMRDDDVQSGTSPDPSLIGLCPYLMAADGGWRSSTAAREHRCTGVSPPAPLPAEKQRRLCLTPEHDTCATYVAVRAARSTTPGRAEVLSRPLTRTTPVVLDHGRMAVRLPALRDNRVVSQGLLVGVMGIAFAAIVLARQSGSNGSVVDGSPTPVASVRPLASPSASPRREPTVAPSPSVVPPAAPSAAPASPRPSAQSATYKVRSGDTLMVIAARFGTTAKVLIQLNAIKDPALLRIGQVLLLP